MSRCANSPDMMENPHGHACASARRTSLFYRVRWNASGCGGKKFVTLNAGGDAAAPVVRLNAQHTRIAADVNIAGERNLLRKCENKLDRAACFNGRLDQEVKTAK